jgi:hypothetical protein
VRSAATQFKIAEMTFLAESHVNLSLQMSGTFDCFTVIDIAAQYLNVDMCTYLVTLNVLEAEYALYTLIIAVHGHIR